MSSQPLDPLSWIIPTIIAAIVSFIIVALNRFTKTSDSTISGTIEIKGIQERLDGLEHNMSKSFDKMEKDMDTKHGDILHQMEKMKDKVASNRGDIDLNTYRIQQLEDKTRNGNRNGGLKSAV